MGPIDFEHINKKKILWKSMASISCLVTEISSFVFSRRFGTGE